MTCFKGKTNPKKTLQKISLYKSFSSYTSMQKCTCYIFTMNILPFSERKLFSTGLNGHWQPVLWYRHRKFRWQHQGDETTDVFSNLTSLWLLYPTLCSDKKPHRGSIVATAANAMHTINTCRGCLNSNGLVMRSLHFAQSLITAFTTPTRCRTHTPLKVYKSIETLFKEKTIKMFYVSNNQKWLKIPVFDRTTTKWQCTL